MTLVLFFKLSIPSKDKFQYCFIIVFVPFLRRIFFMTIALKIHLKKCGSKLIKIKMKIIGINYK